MGWLNRALRVHHAKDNDVQTVSVEDSTEVAIKRKPDINENLLAVPKTESRPPTRKETKKRKKLEKKMFERKQQEKSDRIQALVKKSYAHKTRSI
jgi:hypothetical protein